MKQIEEHFLDKSLSYSQYIQLTETLVSENKTTGEEQTQELIEFTKLNLKRIERLNKTINLNQELTQIIKDWTTPMTILVITEVWCGDVAQQLPWFQKLSLINPLIQIRTILRDENPELMNRYLTNGISKSIPVILFLNEKNEELFKWGPRTFELQNLLKIWGQENLTKMGKYTKIHTWYTQNKGIDLQKEIIEIFKSLEINLHKNN